MNTTEFLNITSLIVPDRTAIVFDGKRFSFQELEERVKRLANALSGMGVGAGDRIATMQVNCNENIETYFAAAKLDAVYVPLNFRSRPEEIEYMINDSKPKVLITGERYVSMVDEIKPDLTSVAGYVVLDDASEEGWESYEHLLSVSSDEDLYPTGDEDDLTMVMFTAGTTGSPKGVMLSHDSFASYILANVSPPELESEEKNILTVPLYHIAGIQAVMAAIYGGRTLIIQRQFEPLEWMALVQEERANRAMMVPTMLKMLMDHQEFEKFDLSTLEVITYGAAPMPLEVIKRAISKFPGTFFINAFGQTETAATITMLPPEDHVLEGSEEEIEKKLNRLTSIGKPLSDVDVRIVNDEGGDVNVGETGEIVAQGPRLMKGYWNQQEATAEALRGGWLYTGDLGYFDEDGYIFLSGRAKDFIKRAGEMVSPEEVEQVLHSHPSIDEAAIIGVPDIDWGERVRAIVVAKIGATIDEEEVMAYCKDRMASFKKPESVVVVEELPRNPLGKVLKRVLREEFSYPLEN
ncbi:MAG TPA: long-chain-fatty-acid--CoA ligase [SAR202 cluster bacterium]|jgi:acyl-CoA synthetase (AMP-forming)/AMP-acid ligase II|nr:long-chain-fatty-acid--CoA ligase [SAR202 cluster bacterium]HJO59862.1 long-chain-fatty-acid--CoA ligase [SAR202 cluster bacterium]|tara:strand:- start:2545 stop:4110 length:1566 start_codon:yes stop_codon:yes gene_type:complete